MTEQLTEMLERYQKIDQAMKSLELKKEETRQEITSLLKRKELPKVSLDIATVSLVTTQKIADVDYSKVPEGCVVKSVTMASIKAWQKEMNADYVPNGVTFENSESLRITFTKE